MITVMLSQAGEGIASCAPIKLPKERREGEPVAVIKRSLERVEERAGGGEKGKASWTD